MMPDQTKPEWRRHADAAAETALSRRSPAWVFLWAVVIFIIYGSLFPFDFQATPLPLDNFFSEWDIFENRADAIDNFLLFVPLGIALHTCFTGTRARLTAAFFAVLVLAFGIQLVQLYLPSRTASLSDAFWNSVGMAAGFLIAARVRRLLETHLSATTSRHDYFALLLVLLWFFYESFPFIPTLDIGLLRDHVKSAVFAPPFELMRFTHHYLAATLAGVAMLRVNWMQARYLNLLLIGSVSLLLEVFVAYGSLRRETLLGISIGLLTGYLLETRLKKNQSTVIFLLALSAYLITVLTPYRDQTLGAGFTLTPFSHLFWQGITKDIPPTAFEALAIACLLWTGLSSQRRFRHTPYTWVGCVMLLLVILEWVRVTIVGYHGDTTPLVVAIVLSPFAVSLRTLGTSDKTAARTSSVQVSPALDQAAEPAAPSFRSAQATPPLASTAKPSIFWIAATLGAMTLGLWLLLHLPGIPYNLKKIFGDQLLSGAAFFSLALLWLGSAPWLLAQLLIRRTRQGRHALLWTPVLLLGIALISLALIQLATPEIMLNKIIGAPDLYHRIVYENYWGEAWRARLAGYPVGLIEGLESSVRYCALYSIFMIPLTLAALALPKQNRTPRVLAYLLLLLPFWYLAKYVVIDSAITDNLIELMKPNGLVFLAALIITLSLHASILASYFYRTRVRSSLKLCISSIALVALSWWLLNQGIESLIVKDGSVFSGIQFILGENRTSLLSDSALFWRWCLLYLSGVGVTALGMLFAMRLVPDNSAPRRKRRSKTPKSKTMPSESEVAGATRHT